MKTGKLNINWMGGRDGYLSSPFERGEGKYSAGLFNPFKIDTAYGKSYIGEISSSTVADAGYAYSHWQSTGKGNGPI